MKKGICISITLLLLCAVNLMAQYRTPEAGRYYYWLFSPDLLSKSMGYGGSDKPSGMIINPGSNAFVQKIKIEVAYGLAPGLLPQNGDTFQTAGDFFLPFMINGGFVIPTRYGNFTTYINYMNMSNKTFGLNSNDDMAMGKIWSVHFGFSKDYSDRFAFGMSGNFKISWNPQEDLYIDGTGYGVDAGGGFDFGFIWRPGIYRPLNKKKPDNWAFQDFQISFVLKDLGKPLFNFQYHPDNPYTLPWFTSLITPAAAIEFNLFNNGSTHWKWMADVSAPFFQNLRLAVGTEIQIVKLFVLRGSYTFDLEGVLEYSGAIPQYEYLYNMANVGFGFSFRFSKGMFKKSDKEQEKEKRHQTNVFSIDFGGRPYHNGFVFEAGCTIQIGKKDTVPPEITYIQKDTFASPNLDGIQDDIVIELDIQDERYIKMWKLEIYDKDGTIVRTIQSKEERKETVKFKDVVKRYFKPKTGIPIPGEVIWDGRDDGGTVVTDGTYTFKFYAMDDNKNMNLEGSAEGAITIDTQDPNMEVKKVTNTIFSPNNDGSKDTIIIDIDIIEGKVDNSFIPDEAGSLLEPAEFKLIEMEETPVLIEQNVGNSNNSGDSSLADGKTGGLILEPGELKIINMEEIPVIIGQDTGSSDSTTGENSDKPTEQIWYIDILDVNETLIKRHTYLEKGEVRIEWNGKDEKGNQMPDGVYSVKLHSVDLAGNYWEKTITNIIINTEPTPIEAAIVSNIFSPNNDGVKDLMTFKFTIPVQTGIEEWNYQVMKNGQTVKTFSGTGNPPVTLDWDGKNEENAYVPEGTYKGKLTVIYVNGNKPSGETPLFTVDVTPPDATVALSLDVFSPDGDGNKDEVFVTQNTSAEEEWLGYIYDEQGKKLNHYLWKGAPPKKFAWGGKNSSGNLLDDGTYYYQVVCTDLAGNYFESPKEPVKIFTANTPVFITYAYDFFSPNSDGVKDVQKLNIKAQISSDNKVKSWALTIFDDKESPVYTTGKPGDIVPSVDWKGIDDAGGTVIDGEYRAVLEVEFMSGTKSSSSTGFFTIDTVPPEVTLKAVSDIFSPNNDGNLDTYEILQKGSEEDLWSASITGPGNKEIWTAFYSGKPKKKQIWTGKDMSGNLQKNGLYSYKIESTDKAGNRGEALLPDIKLENVYTSLFLTLAEEKFSPNRDSKFDTISMTPFVNVKEGIELYSIQILDEEKKPVKTYKGEKDIPAKVVWDGIDDNGSPAKDGIYSAILTVKYRFGNKPQVESAKFILDTTPPELQVTYRPEFFSPDDDNVEDEVAINITSYDLAGFKNWKIIIHNPKNTKEFKSYSGEGKPTEKIIWNGLSQDGNQVESAEDYPVSIYAEDEVGNILQQEVDPLMVDILVLKLPDGRLKIRISNINFKPNSDQMTDTVKNKRVLDLLARALKKYGLYKITIEGHANRFREGLDENLARDLSERRSQTISRELNKRGILLSRMNIIGRGFDQPLVPLTPEAEKEELATNRRVEFYLDKK